MTDQNAAIITVANSVISVTEYIKVAKQIHTHNSNKKRWLRKCSVQKENSTWMEIIRLSKNSQFPIIKTLIWLIRFCRSPEASKSSNTRWISLTRLASSPWSSTTAWIKIATNEIENQKVESPEQKINSLFFLSYKSQCTILTRRRVYKEVKVSLLSVYQRPAARR